jgi:hypothetical protein
MTVPPDDATVSRTQFALVPAWVYTTVTDPMALRLYVILSGKYANGSRRCFPFETTLATDLEISTRHLKTLMGTLRAAGAVVVTPVRTSSGRRNHYFLPMDEPPQSAPLGEPQFPTPPGVGEPQFPMGGEPQFPYNHTQVTHTQGSNQTQGEEASASSLRETPAGARAEPDEPRLDTSVEDHDLLGEPVASSRSGVGTRARKPRASKLISPVPVDFTITPSMRSWFEKEDLAAQGVDLDHHTARFLDHHTAKGTKFKNWEAAWRNWMRLAAKFAQEQTHTNSPRRDHRHVGYQQHFEHYPDDLYTQPLS